MVDELREAEEMAQLAAHPSYRKIVKIFSERVEDTISKLINSTSADERSVLVGKLRADKQGLATLIGMPEEARKVVEKFQEEMNKVNV